MAHLWVETEEQEGKEWALAPLEGAEAFVVTGKPLKPLKRLSRGKAWRSSEGEALLVLSKLWDMEAWVLVVPDNSSCRVNGDRLRVGLLILRDRDEITINADRHLFFSTERPAIPVPFAGSAEPMICPRCKQEIEPGMDAVMCPNPKCRVWHHQIAAPDAETRLPCWTYGETCVMCDQSTALDAGYRWTPEGL